MLLSSKLERDIILLRLQDALKTTPNTDIKIVVDSLLDLKQIEEAFLKVNRAYELGFIQATNNHLSPNLKSVNYGVEFHNAFWELSKVFSNHPEVQKLRRTTDDSVDAMSNGDCAVFRGKGLVVGKNKSKNNKPTQNWGPVNVQKTGVPYPSQVPSTPTQQVPGTTPGTPTATSQVLGIQAKANQASNQAAQANQAAINKLQAALNNYNGSIRTQSPFYCSRCTATLKLSDPKAYCQSCLNAITSDPKLYNAYRQSDPGNFPAPPKKDKIGQKILKRLKKIPFHF